ncbi:FHA domain-containing protein [Clostridium sp.]|uniref:FHA domain-containing protein n=1 Tax=Clostridium sp. TaxID=1506 RepID=UPI0025B8CBF4|nr:FHA domain-containing protein [Clostridium sp.]
MSYIIKESRESTYISYTLNNENDFFDVGYKVLQNQGDSGFVKCNKITHNGKIKLLYDISKYKDLETLIHSASTENLINILIKLFKVVMDVKENGFIEYKNINTNLNTIFVDPNNLTIKMIYIPINIENGRNEKIFLEELRTNILDAINNSTHNGVLVSKLRAKLNKGNSFEEIINDLNNHKINNNLERYEYNSEKNREAKPLIINENMSKNDINKKKDNNDKKSYISSFSSIFFKKNKDKYEKEEDKETKQEIKDDYDYDEYYEGTTLIDDFDVKKIKIKGIDSPTSISILIDKDDFILGSSYSLADGVITFNKAISRKHCSIRKKGDKYYLTDLGSSNGTFVNGVRLAQGDSVEIKVGDKIKLANSLFSIEENT